MHWLQRQTGLGEKPSSDTYLLCNLGNTDSWNLSDLIWKMGDTHSYIPPSLVISTEHSALHIESAPYMVTMMLERFTIMMILIQ